MYDFPGGNVVIKMRMYVLNLRLFSQVSMNTVRKAVSYLTLLSAIEQPWEIYMNEVGFIVWFKLLF